MTAQAFAQLLHARRIGKNRWQALCPAHPDRNPSLAISVGRKVPVIIRCKSNGCDTRYVLAAMGMKWADLFDSDRKQDWDLARQIRKAQEKHEREQRTRKNIAYSALRRAYTWDAISQELGRLLAAYPDDDRLGILFHRSLAYMRRCECIARSYWDARTWGSGILPARRYRWPLKLTRAEIGDSEIAWRLGICK